MRVLHAIHDFLPRHRAGSEIYAYDLTRELSKRHDVFVATAEYDPATPHGTIRWRACDGLPVIEVVNNWEFADFDETYSSPRLNRQLGHVLDATRPDVLHVHNLLNLSFDLPRLARERGVSTVATLHDYTLVCASGGQRVHAGEAHVCEVIDTERCARCFTASPFHAQLTLGRAGRRLAGRVPALAGAVHRRLPMLARRAASHLPGSVVTPEDLQRRLAYSRHVFEQIDRFVAPSAALADEYIRLGLDGRRIEVSDYGFVTVPRLQRTDATPVRFGFVGTLVWHKGAHVFLEALKHLRGNFHAEVYGDPAVFPAYASELRRLAEGLPVRFHGGFGRDRLAETYASIDVLVVPSLWPENSPLVIHEAFMHGAAVVAARMGGIPELVRDGVNGFLYDALRADALGDWLQRFIDDPRLAPRLAASAPPVKRMEEDAREWEDRYESVMGSPRRVAEPA
jgi:glycosyltransferase involved in cell wall biosynthesis